MDVVFAALVFVFLIGFVAIPFGFNGLPFALASGIAIGLISICSCKGRAEHQHACEMKSTRARSGSYPECQYTHRPGLCEGCDFFRSLRGEA